MRSREDQRLFLVVGDEDEGDADIPLQRQQLDLELLAELEIERAQRLVEQQHAAVVDERPGERHALLLAARELRRLAVGEGGDLHHRQRLVDPGGDLRSGHLLHPQAEGDVVAHGEMGEEGVGLEDRVDGALVRRNLPGVDAADPDDCPRRAGRDRR